MNNDPVYFSFEEFVACFPDFFVDPQNPTPEEQDAAEDIIRRAESITDGYINCEKCRYDWGYYDCYCYKPYVGWISPYKFQYVNCPPERTFPRCEDCCPVCDQGSFDASTETELPKNTTRFQIWLVSGSGTVEGLTMTDGQYLVALSTRAVTQSRDFELLDEKPHEICFIPDDVRRAIKMLIESLIASDQSGSSGDCLEGLDITIGDLSIKQNNNKGDNETRAVYPTQYYELLERFRCLGAIIQ